MAGWGLPGMSQDGRGLLRTAGDREDGGGLWGTAGHG